jgi:hypothetical protein
VILIEHQAHMDPPLDGGLKSSERCGPWSVRQPQVVDRDVERPRRPVQERGDPLRDQV